MVKYREKLSRSICLEAVVTKGHCSSNQGVTTKGHYKVTRDIVAGYN